MCNTNRSRVSSFGNNEEGSKRSDGGALPETTHDRMFVRHANLEPGFGISHRAWPQAPKEGLLVFRALGASRLKGKTTATSPETYMQAGSRIEIRSLAGCIMRGLHSGGSYPFLASLAGLETLQVPVIHHSVGKCPLYWSGNRKSRHGKLGREKMEALTSLKKMGSGTPERKPSRQLARLGPPLTHSVRESGSFDPPAKSLLSKTPL